MDSSTEGPLNAEQIGGREQSNAPEISLENVLLPNISSESLQQSEDLTLRPAANVHSQVMHEVDAAECPSDNNLRRTVSPTSNSFSSFGTSQASGTTTSGNNFKFIKAGSPMKLLQEYASDDSSENDDKLLHKDIIPSPPKLLTSLAGTSPPIKDTSSCFQTDTRSKSQLCKSNTNHSAADNSPTSFGEVESGGVTFAKTRINVKCQENNHVNKKGVKVAISHLDSRNESIVDDGGAHDISKTHKILKENEEKQAKSVSVSLRVDEFGRLAREGLSDSDSDRGYANRHERRAKRDRSRSRSRSPVDKRRTRRSLRRRKDTRSRSRSWSPRNRRSRSRSPSHRRSGEFSGEKIRSNRTLTAQCFDFMRGRCHRGASCRYMHHEVGKSDSSRRYRGKQKNPEVPSGKENHKTKKESRDISVKLPDHGDDKTQIQQIEDGRVDWKREDIVMDSQQAISFDHIGEMIDSGMINCPSPKEVSGTVQQMTTTLEKSAEPNLQIHDDRTFCEKSHESIDNFPSHSVNSIDNLNTRGDTSQVVHPLVNDSRTHQHESNTSVAEDQNADRLSRQTAGSYVSDALPHQTTIDSPKNLSNSVSVPNIILPTGSLPSASSSQSLPSEAVPSIPHESSQLPPPPPFPPPNGANAPHMPQLPIGYTSTAQTAPFLLQSSHPMNPRNYQACAANQHPEFFAPSNSFSTLPLPTPRPPFELWFGAETATPGVSSQFQQSHFLPRNEFGSQIPVRPPTTSHFGSQVTGLLHQSHPTIQERHQPDLQTEYSSSNNLRTQLLAPGILREELSTHPTVQKVNTSNSLGLGSLHQQPVTSQELYVNRMLHGNIPSGQLLQSSSEIRPFSHMQAASGHLKYHLGDDNVGFPVKTDTMSQSSWDPNFGIPQIVAHHNPYASTFEQPLGSKLSLASLSQDKGPISANQLNIPLNLKNATVDGQGVGSYGCRQTTSSPSSARADGKILTSAGDHQYDPLFDSIEPTKKDCHSQKWEPASDSVQIEKRIDSHKLVDLDENSRHDVAAVASTTSLDNDDFGETADAEVGTVEDESPINPVGADTAEETQAETKSTGKKKKKKKKDSRSTNPFKVAIAEFVKDVLKPSWRQGNMSKEAFKTIVKKTVDKVSGAMKGHNVPKSRAKIDQYIDSSQRKLTKLVMGYVDKYVKV